MTATKNPNEKQMTAPEYIRANFHPSDRIAVLMRKRGRGETIQRISTADKIAATPFQDWLHYKNDKENCDVYVGMDALKPESHTRTKDDILAIRHLYVDLDHYGLKSLAAIEQSDLVPKPSYVLNTSPDKFQIIWKVEEMTQQQAEAMLHALAAQFNGDPAATDSTRVLRLPSFLNKKREEDFLVKIHSQTGLTYHPPRLQTPHRTSRRWSRKMEPIAGASILVRFQKLISFIKPPDIFRAARPKLVRTRLGLRQTRLLPRRATRRRNPQHRRIPRLR